MRQRYEIPQPGELFDPAIYRLGSPCKRNHFWDEGVTLRTVKHGKCPTCERIDALEGHARRKAADPDSYKAKRSESMRRHRELHGRESRSKYGLPHGFLEANGLNNAHGPRVAKLLADGLTVEAIREQLQVEAAFRSAGQAPSVARLVYGAQQQRWKQCPTEKAQHDRWWNAELQRFRYLVDPALRLYHRSKSKKRKAQERGSRTAHLTPDQLWRRWVEFGHRCAYCGAGGDLQVEHVTPISKGGEHHLGNIVPACQRCNFSKGKADPEAWFRAQLYFTEARWQAIRSALAKGQPDVRQLPLL